MSKRVENFIKEELENLKIADKKGEVKVLDTKTEHSFGKYC
jgi:predicted RNA-binding protein Jag